MEDFIRVTVFGGVPCQQVASYIWFFLIGYTVYGLNEVSERDKSSKNTPREWSWRFWATDNGRRYLYTVLATYIMFRFHTEFNEYPLTDIGALMMGLVGDGVGATIKRKSKATQMHRDKLMYETKEVIE